jgi:abequosyltransferase
MSAVALSVCIPVYNCGEFLPAALDSVLSQWQDGVEVVVFDGGSTDDTPEVMARYAREHVRYVRAEARGGIDADLATCVGHARGAWCWLFSGDDVMRPGALAAALREIGAGADVLVCRHTVCDIAMRVQYDYPVLQPVEVPAIVELRDAGERLAWFARAATTEAFFSFLSGLVVRKAAWDRGRMHPQFARSCWAHVARLLALSGEGLRVAYVPEIWLDQRGENDSFASAGVVNRYRIAIEGFHALGDALFGHDSPEAFHLRRVLRFEFTLEMFLVAKVICRQDPAREDRALLDRLYAQLHCDPSLRSRWLLLVYRCMPTWFAAGLRETVRKLRRARAKLSDPALPRQA